MLLFSGIVFPSMLYLMTVISHYICDDDLIYLIDNKYYVIKKNT